MCWAPPQVDCYIHTPRHFFFGGHFLGPPSLIFPYRYAYFALFWPLKYKYLSVSLPMVNYFHYLKGRTQAYRYISLHIANLEKLKNMCFLLRKRDFPFFCDMYIFRSVSTYCSFSFKRSLDAHMCIPNLRIERTVSTCLAGYLLTLFPESYYAQIDVPSWPWPWKWIRILARVMVF